MGVGVGAGGVAIVSDSTGVVVFVSESDGPSDMRMRRMEVMRLLVTARRAERGAEAREGRASAEKRVMVVDMVVSS